MSDPNPNTEVVEELTDEQIAALQPAPSEADQLGELRVPKKFIGKSPEEILQAQQETESYAGKLSSELGQERKRSEELEERLKTLEARISSSAPQQVVQHPAPQPEVDPFESLAEVWEEDPKQAFLESQRLNRELIKKQEERRSQELLAQSATDYYETQKKENPDYVRREDAMQKLLIEYQDVFQGNKIASAKVLKLINLASQGRDLSYYEEQAIAKASKSKQDTNEEKRAAHSEASYSEGDETVSVDSLSDKELEELVKGFS